MPFERVRRLIGKGSDKLIPELICRHDERIGELKTQIFKRRYLAQVRPFPAVRELLHSLRTRGLKLAVASSASQEELGALLDVAGVAPCFDALTDADDAEHSKPDPDIV